jgi:phage terminase large subunit-like protein
LETPTTGYESFGGSIADFAQRELGITLFEWQAELLVKAFQHQDGLFVHSTVLASTARQNGKSYLLRSIVGWALLDLPRLWGRPVSILSTAHELSLAAEVFEAMRDTLERWEESGLCKVTWAYGRQKVQMVDGSTWKVLAATGKKHGGTYDIILGDELWALSEATIFSALRPSQIAVPSPMLYLTSTAGDEGSTAYLKLREQALGIIDSGVPSDMYMAEWSMPDGCDPLDERYWGYANPSLGRTITLKGLRSAAASPDRAQFIRAHLNKWVSAANSWMPLGMWSKRRTDWNEGEGGVLAVDSATDGSKYVGVWARPDPEGHVVVSMAFTTESNFDMWHEITRRLEADSKLKLAITPGLYVHTPEKYRQRTTQWGYGELLKFVGLVRSFIIEGRILHTGETMLAEHVNRAVLVKAENSIVISSQRSPGPIEAARCMVVAAALVSAKPASARPSMGSSRR